MAEDTTELRSQIWKHECFVEWATGEGLLTGKETPAQVIAVFAARRNAFRKSELYTSAIENHASEIEAEKAERAEARAAASAERAAEREAAKAAKAAAKAAAPKAEKATKEAKAPAKATKARKATKATSEEDAFG